MIGNVFFTILFFLLGIVDNAFNIVILGYTFYFGMLIYLTLIVLMKNKAVVTVFGFAYFLGLGSGGTVIGLLPLFVLIVEYLYFLSLRIFFANNKLTLALITGVYFIIIFALVHFIFNGYRINWNFSFFIIALCIGIYGAGMSLLSKYTKYEG